MKISIIFALWLVWTYPFGPDSGITFEVWHAGCLCEPFTLWTNVVRSPVLILGKQQSEFFMVRAVDAWGNVSDWGTL